MPDINDAITEEWLTRTLTDLGDTADDVAATLRDAAIKGRRSNAVQCPVARYLARRVAEHASSTQARVNVHDDATVLVATSSAHSEDLIVSVALPDPVLDFIRDFDEGAYPDLIDDSTP